jgi:hypothetical protein
VLRASAEELDYVSFVVFRGIIGWWACLMRMCGFGGFFYRLVCSFTGISLIPEYNID